MSKMKKLASIVLALVMVCSMCVTAFAADSYTITINNTTDGYVYTAYQIFAGTLSTDGETLSNITWGTGITTEGIAAVKTAYGTDDAAEVAALITTEAKAEEFATVVGSYVTSGTNSTDQGDTYTIEVSVAGYYLIANTKVPSSGTYTKYILKIVDNVTVAPKSSTTVFDKSTEDINDSTNETESSTDSADYDIGDDVPFTLTATLPDDYASYTEYNLVFHDTMSAGLTFNSDSVIVTAGSITLKQGVDYEVLSIEDAVTGETAITITVEDLKTISGLSLSAGDTVVVTYTAKLNDNASYMEENAAYLDYSNNPNGSSTGTSTTDKTTVFTFNLTVNKVDSNGDALSGAGFTLYKYDADATGDDKYVIVGTEQSERTSFTWDGLDDGDYKLVETTTPSGYNTMDDLYFTVEAVHEEGKVTSLIIKDADGNTISGEGKTFTTSTTNGSISADITNYTGSELPSTGGIGTTVFYIVGTILVLGAAVLLITRRRMSKAE